MPQEAPDAYEARVRSELQRFYRETVIEVLDAGHTDRDYWLSKVSGIRDELRRADQRALRAVRDLPTLSRPVNAIFRDTYTLDNPHVRPPAMRGSCPVTRSTETDGRSVADPELIVEVQLASALSPRLEAFRQAYADDAHRCWIAVERAETSRVRQQRTSEVRDALRRLATLGVVEFALPPQFLSDSDWGRIVDYSPGRFVLRSDLAERDTLFAPPPPVARLTFLDEDAAARADVVSATMSASRPFHLIVMPIDTPEPALTSRHIFDMRRSLNWRDFVEAL
jgi:hypothetical protein